MDLSGNNVEPEMSLLDYDRLQAARRGISFSMRDLLVGVAIVAVLITAYGNFGWLAIGPGLLGLSILLMRWGERRQHLAASRTGVMLLFLGGLISLAALGAYLLLGLGPRLNRNRWPDIVHEIANAAGDDLRGARVHGLGSDFLDDSYIWRQRVPRDRIEAVSKKIASHQVEGDDVPAWFFASFPWSWLPSRTEESRFYSPGTASDGFGADYEDTIILMYDPETEMLFGWRHWRF